MEKIPMAASMSLPSVFKFIAALFDLITIQIRKISIFLSF